MKSNFELLNSRLKWQGGNQEGRIIKDKYNTFLRTLKYSYQGVDVRKIGEETIYRALINPDKNKEDYDTKILSIDYKSGFQSGDIFEWINTDTYWLIYLQELTEDAYFRSEIIRCRYKLQWVDDNVLRSTWCYVRGPVETKINAIQKNGISVDVPNWSLEIYVPDIEEHRKYFKRNSRFIFDNTAWEVQVVDHISTQGIIQIVALEHFADKATDDIENNLANAFKIVPVREQKNDDVISGEGFIKPRQEVTYTANVSGGQWYVKEQRPVTIAAKDNICKITWDKVVSGTFTLIYNAYGEEYEKMIVVESLF